MPMTHEQLAELEQRAVVLAGELKKGTGFVLQALIEESNAKLDRKEKRSLRKGIKAARKAYETISESDFGKKAGDTTALDVPSVQESKAVVPEHDETDLLAAIVLATGARSPSELQLPGRLVPQSESDE
jgi:hypothetical protein